MRSVWLTKGAKYGKKITLQYIINMILREHLEIKRMRESNHTSLNISISKQLARALDNEVKWWKGYLPLMTRSALVEVAIWMYLNDWTHDDDSLIIRRKNGEVIVLDDADFHEIMALFDGGRLMVDGHPLYEFILHRFHDKYDEA